MSRKGIYQICEGTCFPVTVIMKFAESVWICVRGQLGCNFFFTTSFTYRFRHSIRNIKRSIFLHRSYPLKRPPSGRKVSSTIKSVSPRMWFSQFPETTSRCTYTASRNIHFLFLAELGSWVADHPCMPGSTFRCFGFYVSRGLSLCSRMF